ncbi:hypothetical protein GGR57DRAFT_42410 [Xylariaceae sp. FL1272]|nr:hypothetical protein GGR57DRAFT_42410 [Xylariaceae sp. FL1272]
MAKRRNDRHLIWTTLPPTPCLQHLVSTHTLTKGDKPQETDSELIQHSSKSSEAELFAAAHLLGLLFCTYHCQIISTVMALSSLAATCKGLVDSLHMHHTCGNCGTEYTSAACWYCHPQNRPHIEASTSTV